MRCKAYVLGVLGLTVLGTSSLRALDLTFNNISGVDASQIWIQFQGASTDQVSYGSNQVSFDPSTSFLTAGISLQDLNTNYSGKFDITTLSGSFFISMGSSALPLQVAAPAFIGGAASPTPFQKIELTHASSNASSGGDAEAINYLSIPLGINSYSGSGVTRTLQQSKQWQQSTAQVVSSIQGMSGYNSNFYTTSGPSGTGDIVRYLGPTSFPPPPGEPALPYPTWNTYLGEVHAANQTTTLVNGSGFNVLGGAIVSGASPGSVNYNFQFNLAMTVDADNNIVLAGNIVSVATPYGSGPEAPVTFENVSITLPADATDFTFAIYGSIFPTGTDFGPTSGGNDGWTQFIDYINGIPGLNAANIGAGTVLSNQIAGEVASGFIMGFVNSDWEPTLTSGPVKDMPSNEWWANYVASETLQPDALNYNEWSALIAAATNNEIYSNPYSDRFANPDNPSIASLNNGSTPITEWEITIGAPVSVPEPSTYALLLMVGGMAGMWTFVKKRRAR